MKGIIIKLKFWPWFLILALTGCNQTQDFGAATAFTLQTENGTTKTLQSYGVGSLAAPGDRYLLINFWASWCKPCIQEIPLLKAFAKDNNDIVVLGVAADRIEPAKAFAKRLEIDYPVLYGEYDQLNQMMNDYGNDKQALPYSVLINSSGQIIWRHTGLLRMRDLTKLPD